MNADVPERESHFQQLRRSLEALAASASVQRSLFPERAVTADERARDFDHWVEVIRSNYEDELDDEQRQSLRAIDEAFASMSRDAAELDADVWSESAVRTTEAWVTLRRLAVEALRAFPESSGQAHPDSERNE
jgi:hypothetical protein